MVGEFRAIVQRDGPDSAPTRLQQADHGRFRQLRRDLGQSCRQQIATATLDQRDQARLLVPLDYGVALPVADEAPVISLNRAVLDAYPVRDLAQPSALGLSAVLAAAFGLAEMPPEIATLCLVIPDQGVDPLMTDAYACQGRDEATDLLWAPLLTQPADNSGNQAWQALGSFPGGTAPAITEGLGLLGIVATGDSVAPQFTADRAAVETQLPADLPLAHAHVIAGVYLVSLGLGQLSVSHALLHFGR